MPCEQEGLAGGDGVGGTGRDTAASTLDCRDQLLVGTRLLRPLSPWPSLIFTSIPCLPHPSPPVGSSSLP